MLHEALTITSVRLPSGGRRAKPARALRWATACGPARSAPGSRICLVGVGKLVAACEQAAHIGTRGVDATVWDAFAVASPLDPAMIEDAMAHDLVVSAEDGILEGGVGSRINASLRAAAPAGVGPAVVNCGVPTAYLPHGEASDILAHLGLDGPGISRTVLDHL